MSEAYPDENITIPEQPEHAEIESWYSLYFSAFTALMHDRNYAGMNGVALPISYTAISKYAADHSIPNQEFDVFTGLIRALDDEWLDFMNSKTREGQ